MEKSSRLPRWLKMQRASGENYSRVKHLVDDNKLHTICTSGNCPNIGECWNSGTATFMILGDICTRACKFCNTRTGKPMPPISTKQNDLQKQLKNWNLSIVSLHQLTVMICLTEVHHSGQMSFQKLNT